MMLHGIHFPEDQIAALCAKHGIARLSLFGSILTPDFDAESDVDVLVEFQPTARPTLFTLGGILHELECITGRPVDVIEPLAIPLKYRTPILQKSRVLHAA